MPITIEQLTERFDRLFAAWKRVGKELYLVGGCVRDVVMGLDEVGDIDLTTDALPDETREILEKNRLPAYPIGARFGTISTIVDGSQVEITTFRVDETYEARNRKPEVVFGSSLIDDLARRDLSMNAMAAGPGGHLIDPFDGQRAIRQRLLEVPGGGLDATRSILRDDPLRLLRVARFAARFAFTPTSDTTQAARETAGELAHISHERWKMEMDKLLVAPHVEAGLSWLFEIDAFAVLIPPLGRKRMAKRADAYERELLRCVAQLPLDPVVRWSALALLALSAEGASEQNAPLTGLPTERERRRAWAHTLAERFRFSNEEKRRLRRFVESFPTRSQLDALATRIERRRWLALWEEDALAAYELASAMLAHPLDAREALEQAITEEDIEIRLPAGFGAKVIRHFALPRGPQIARAIDHLKRGIIDGDVENGASVETYLRWLEDEQPRWRDAETSGDLSS